MSIILSSDDFEKLRKLSAGQPAEVYVLPRKNESTRLTPVFCQDGRGEWKQGHISGINVCVDFGDGTHCWLHPSTINNPYNLKCRIDS